MVSAGIHLLTFPNKAFTFLTVLNLTVPTTNPLSNIRINLAVTFYRFTVISIGSPQSGKARLAYLMIWRILAFNFTVIHRRISGDVLNGHVFNAHASPRARRGSTL